MFLNRDLDDVIFMEQPKSYEEVGEEDYVCRLDKALYGLKQSARSWNDDFKQKCIKIAFE